jgi:hypothetical protein
MSNLSDLERAGLERFIDAFRKGDDLAKTFDQLLQDGLRGFSAPLSGALVAARGIMDACLREKVVNFAGTAADGWDGPRIGLEAARRLALRDYQGLADLLGLVAGALHAARKSVPRLKQLRVEEPEESKQAEPQLVRVVSLPVRQTNTRVERDAAGFITSSTQLESDVERVEP